MLSIDPKTSNFPASSPYSYAANNPVYYIDREGEDPVEPLSVLEIWWYTFIGHHHVVRANRFAVANGIDEENIYHITLPSNPKEPGERSTVLIYHPVLDKATGETIYYKHVFRQTQRDRFPGKQGIDHFIGWNCDDTEWAIWDNYFDDEGNPIPFDNDFGKGFIDAPMPGPGAGSKIAKGGRALFLMGSASKTWTVYTFMTRTGRYYGISINFMRRMAQHGTRILGKVPDKGMIENIPDIQTARGIEQLFIEWGRKAGIITQQINSVSPKRVKDYDAAIKKGTEFLKKNYKGLYDYIYK